jgi:hypothetical protein
MNTLTTADIRNDLDTLFALQVSGAELPTKRDAAILQALPPEYQEIISGLMREYDGMVERIETEANELRAQVRANVTAIGAKVVGTHLQATYSPGRRTWDTDGLLALAARTPEINGCLHIGSPVVTIRAKTSRKPTAPMLYDTHQ